ncbi:MAG: pirin family protein [Hyphomicrobiales bacterium]|nr:pirin family protein [Hyphomicrobiales bacterium]
MTDRGVVRVLTTPNRHWVGDGFLVRPIFAEAAFTEALSPFLMFDWAAERTFPPSATPRGVGPHPHRGFETVTLVYAGEVAHRDSAGHADRIGAGDVQWMTAGSGLVHEEMLGGDVDAHGGAVSMAQLWVNLPAAAKATPPRYQAIAAAAIPTASFDGASLRVVAGRLGDLVGPAETHTPLAVLDGRVARGGVVDLPIPAGWTGLVAALSGEIDIAGRRIAAESVAVTDREGTRIRIDGVAAESRVLILAGAPLGEPIAQMGPFVMNSRDDLIRAVEDYRKGRMGSIPG